MNLNWIVAGLVVVSVGIFGRVAIKKVAYHQAEKATISQSSVAPAADTKQVQAANAPQVQAQPHQAAVAQKMPAMNEKQKAELQKNIKSFSDRTRKALREDVLGASAYVVLLRSLAPGAFEKDEKAHNLCKTQAMCPVPLSDLYMVGLARLDVAQEVNAKLFLQENMLRSELHAVEKAKILATQMIGTTLHKTKQASRMKDKNQIEIHSNMQYLLATSKQLQLLGISEQEFVQVWFATLKNSKDSVGKRLVLQSLAKAYPKQKPAIQKEAKGMGVKLVASR